MVLSHTLARGNTGNFVEPILAWAHTQAEQIAMCFPYTDAQGQTCYDNVSYGALNETIGRYQAGFARDGLAAGDRVIILCKPNSELYCALLALLASGLVPVFLDPGMGSRKSLQAMLTARPRALISTKAVLSKRWLFPPLWRCRCYAVDQPGFGIRLLSHLRSDTAPAPVISSCDGMTHGLISFTSGSTGRPKGADRTHTSLIEQCHALYSMWPLTPENIGITALPVTVLYGLVCGGTTIVADCDLAAPAQVDPQRLVAQLQRFQATSLTGAPAFITRIARYVAEQHISLPHLQTVFVGGAPSSPAMCRQYQDGFPQAEIIIIYGSTEVEPISAVPVHDILATPGHGVLVGQPIPLATVALVDLPDRPQYNAADVTTYSVKPGTVGEILVKGPHVLRSYVNNPEATRAIKIPCADGEVWHRTGDVGYMDAQQRLWLLGRRADVVSHQGHTLYPYPLEMLVDAVTGVRRSALLQSAHADRALLVIELLDTRNPEAITAAAQDILTAQGLSDLRIQLVDSIPMDHRHNSKIDRPALRQRFSTNKSR